MVLLRRLRESEAHEMLNAHEDGRNRGWGFPQLAKSLDGVMFSRSRTLRLFEYPVLRGIVRAVASQTLTNFAVYSPGIGTSYDHISRTLPGTKIFRIILQVSPSADQSKPKR